MPLPFIVGAVGAKLILGAAVATGVAGAAKGVKGAMDSSEADDVQRKAERILNEAKKSLETEKEKASRSIKKLGESKIKVSSSEINEFVQLFSKIKDIDLKESSGLDELKKLNIKEGMLKEMKDTALEAKDMLTSGIAGIGSGVLLGWGAYGGVMALGTASTGAAIGGLSGIAATNATLAWLGGGALAAGGGGMALGTAVLGGIVAGPALLVAGGIFGAKAKEKLNNAYSNLSEARKIAEELKTAETELGIIQKNSDQLDELLYKLNKQFRYTIERMKEVVYREQSWKKYSDQDKKIVGIAVKYAQAVKAVIDVPLLTKEGALTYEVRDVLKDGEFRAMIDSKL